jgi:ribosomal protein S21
VGHVKNVCKIFMETAQHTVFTNPSEKHKHPKLATRKRHEKIIHQATNQLHE